MYRPTDPQAELFVSGFQLHRSAQRLLERSWASGFRRQVLPLLVRLEHLLAPLYDADNGRPNWSAARMMGLCIIQGWLDLTDRELEQSLAFDVRLQHALDLPTDEAYLSRRSLSDFRLRVVVTDPKGERLRAIFDAVAMEAIDQLGLDVSCQRLDSTQLASNIRTRGKVDLFTRTLRQFIAQAEEEYVEAFDRLPEALRAWYAADSDTSWFGKRGERTPLKQLAQWAVDVGFSFADDRRIVSWESYFLVARLVAEFCVLDADDATSTGSDEREPVCAPAQQENTEQRSTCVEAARESGEPFETQAPSAVRRHSSDAEAGERTADTANGDDRHEAQARRRDRSSSRPGQQEKLPSPGESETEPNGAFEPPTVPQDLPSAPVEETATLLAPSVKDVLSRGRNGGKSLQSPYDPDADYGHKGVGFSLHVTETCGNPEVPEIITDFELRSAADNDWGKSSGVIDRLVERQLAPSTMFADAGYPTPQALLDAERRGVVLHAPVGRQTEPDAFGLERFDFDENGRVLQCPMGHLPTHHDVRREPGCSEPELHAYFNGHTCRGCPLREQCPARGRKTGRFRVRIDPRFVVRDNALIRQQLPHWWQEYAIRSGVEATMSELKRTHGLGRLRVRRVTRVRLNVALRLIACNIKRWLTGTEVFAPG